MKSKGYLPLGSRGMSSFIEAHTLNINPIPTAVPLGEEVVDLCDSDGANGSEWDDDIEVPLEFSLGLEKVSTRNASRATIPPIVVDELQPEPRSNKNCENNPVVISDEDIDNLSGSVSHPPAAIDLSLSSPGGSPSRPNAEAVYPHNSALISPIGENSPELTMDSIDLKIDSMPRPPNLQDSDENSSREYIDLTESHHYTEDTVKQNRLSNLQSEKIGLLEKKVRLLLKALGDKIPGDTHQDLDQKLEKVDKQIISLTSEQSDYQPFSFGRVNYNSNALDDDLVFSSPRKPTPIDIASDLVSSPVDYTMEPEPIPSVDLEPSGYFSGCADEQPTQLSQITRSPWTDEMLEMLTKKFGLLRFRPHQREIVECTLSGRDAIVLMPTGGGKSLCFQLPALCKKGATKGTTVVISPLISLMHDQVYHLKNRDIPAQMINSSLDPADREIAYRELSTGGLNILYLSPEMLNASGRMQSELKSLHSRDLLARIVIDEAHCVSQWGHDFRADYIKLFGLKNEYPKAPIIALTATANREVLSDIERCVRSNYRLFKQSFNRHNLSYEVRQKSDSSVIDEIVAICRQAHGKTGIIFCHSQKSCERTAQELRKQRVSAGYYHAGLAKEQRQQLQESWQEGKVKVMCATIAFGMGVDKPDVRFVVHLTMPRSVEGFYQESGRAGRDGLESKCVLFYSRGDYHKLRCLIENDRTEGNSSKTVIDRNQHNLKLVMQYCENKTDCRRKQILQYFQESISPQKCAGKCDNCQRKRTSKVVRNDMTKEAEIALKLIQNLNGQQVTSLLAVDILRGMKPKRILEKGFDKQPQYGALERLDRTTVERLIYKLIDLEIFVEYVGHTKIRNAIPSTYIKAANGSAIREKVILEFMEDNGAAKGAVTGAEERFRPPSAGTRKYTAPKRKLAPAGRGGVTSQKRFKTGGNSKPTSRIRALPH